MKLTDFIKQLKLAHDVPNYYNNKFPYNCGYYDGSRFSFDCWNLIKAILGGWTDNKTVGYYVSPKDFPTGDIDGYHILMQCTNRSKDFSQLKQPGTYLYISNSPHAGIYLGEFEYNGYTFNVIECTGAWESKVQYTYVDNMGRRYQHKGGNLNPYSWTDYGLLPWVDYSDSVVPTPQPSNGVIDTPFGIDVSRWQKGFQLQGAVNEGFSKVIIKAGGADSGYYKDSAFEDFYSQAKTIGMKIGAYYYGNAFSADDAILEASYFCQYLQGKDIKYVYYDVEGAMLNQGYSHLTSIIQAFCQTMINNEYICGIYTSESQFNSRFDDSVLKMYPHWVAKYSVNMPVLKSGATLDIWQYGGSVNYIRPAQVAGTVIDQDCFYTEWTEEQVFATTPLIIPTTNKKTVDQLAIEVLAGQWGNNPLRAIRLKASGYDSSAVQKRVDEIIAQRKETKKTHIVVKNETLSAIAKRYGTTYKKLAEINGIPKPYTIYPNQELIIG